MATARRNPARKSPSKTTSRAPGRPASAEPTPNAVVHAGDEDGKRAKKDKPDKVIRDSFTMPTADYELIGALKKRCLALGMAMKKSELLRAGVLSLHEMPDERLASVVARIASVKTGRPAGKKDKKTKRAGKDKA